MFDAGLFVAALLAPHPQHAEAFPLVQAARAGQLEVRTTPGILSEVYAALTWERTRPTRTPEEAAEAIRLLIQAPSAIQVLDGGALVALETLRLATAHQLRARRVHDARHAATALVAGVQHVYTYDTKDWMRFEADGLTIAGPSSSLRQLNRSG